VSFDLAGRTVLVAGASSGIGAGFARACAAAGAAVALGARRLDRTGELAAEIEAAGGKAVAVALDITDAASIVAAFDTAEARFGTVNGVVANAGVGTGGRSTEVPAEGLDRVIGTNLRGSYLVAREAAKRLIAGGSRQREDGRIVLIGSTTALETGVGDAAYAATKAGLEHLGRQFAREWIRQGINVNTIHPGWIATEANTGWLASERGKADLAGMHRGRLLEQEALDDLLLFLLSDRSRQVTGATFVVDDGQSL
jgi:NAD(P)-dependent dehydrogenase (short-subunit alcohol dehydrogenase family)